MIRTTASGIPVPARAVLALAAILACPGGTRFATSQRLPGELNLEKAVIVTVGPLSRAESSAVTMLVEEIEKRTLIRPAVKSRWPEDSTPVIALGPAATIKAWAGPYAGLMERSTAKRAAEGYTIRCATAEANKPPAVLICGNDARGVLFATGRLLRELSMKRGQLSISAELNLSTAPRYPIRGHQMGYRPKTNSYDAWTEEIWKQYIRDLVVFGTNAVEMIPPRSDDAPDSPHFPLPQIEMMTRVSRILDDYDMDVWIWYPAMERDYSKAETVEAELKAWGAVFARMPRLNAIFVPGGDPGHTAPAYLMAFLEKVTGELHRHHPKAQMWMSPQSFNREWMADFLRIMKEQQPSWLSGVVYGPQTRISLPELREALPPRYPIRLYPDITHSLSCQYPVPDWDLAYALTEAREGINPRPTDEAAIFRAYKDYAEGFITYSEGCNDDVNKILWSSLGWDPEADIGGILRQYSRYFIGLEYQDGFAQGLFALEHNWRGPLLKNNSVEETFKLFQKMERDSRPQLLLNWRFQQAIYRAYYDAYTQRRLRYETDLEQMAMDKLRQAPAIGSLVAMDQADSIAWEAEKNRTALDLRTRIYQLAEALFQSIRMQLSVPLYKAISVDRGANLDTLDQPLNNRFWLRDQYAEIRKLPEEDQRLRALDRIVHWGDPGQGGFYDQLGNEEARPHLVAGAPYNEDPAFFRSPVTAFAARRGWRMSWCRHADALFDYALRMRYTGLDPEAHYRIRIVYSGSLNNPVRLVADEKWEVHPLMAKPNPIKPVEFDIPPEATHDGELRLSWTSDPGRAGAGRGPQVAEVWLIRR
ncbi:MAG TPA: hypothetical protein VE398_26320 [Acidobacteriota bacterium]|nr:hypothetical protein [Acidobacteriota bacterium]